MNRLPQRDQRIQDHEYTIYTRQDTQRRDIVEYALLMQKRTNTMSALEYLMSQEIDAQVIERVLLEPHRRRAS